MPLKRRPVIGPELQNGYAAAREVLLISHVLIRNDYEIETLLFGETQQFAITQTAPNRSSRRVDLVTRKSIADLYRDTFVKQDFYAAALPSMRRWP